MIQQLSMNVNFGNTSDLSTHELLPNVLRTPKSGISPEKKFVDKFL